MQNIEISDEGHRVITGATLFTGVTYSTSVEGVQQARNALSVYRRGCMPEVSAELLDSVWTEGAVIVDFGKRATDAFERGDFFVALFEANRLQVVAEADLEQNLGGFGYDIAYKTHQTLGRQSLLRFGESDQILQVFGSRIEHKSSLADVMGDRAEAHKLNRALLFFPAFHGHMGKEVKSFVDPYAVGYH